MRAIRTPLPICLLLGSLLTAGISPAPAQVRTLGPGTLANHAVTCERPVRLVHDCSVWQGALRPIALGDFRMTLAADREGTTLLLSRLRPRPDHNHNQFRTRSGRDDPPLADQALERIAEALRARGVEVLRVQPVRSGRRVAAWFVECSDNAYEYLRQFTVLESEHWLPPVRVGP